MTLDPQESARRYLTPPSQSFWQWRDEGEAIAWLGGRTIAFRVELAEILRRREADGLPPLGAVLLLLAAMRESWGEPPSELGTLSGLINFLNGCGAPLGSSEVMVGLSATTPKWITEVFQGLDRIHSLPRELRTSVAARAELMSVVCEGRQTQDREIDAAAVIRALEDGLSEAIFCPVLPRGHALGGPPLPEAIDQLNALLRDLRCLHVGLPRVSEESLRLRVATGLDQLPKATEEELSPTEQIRALLAKLKDDVELGGLARLALNLMAAVHLPRPIADREELPLGGVSDIANRGPLDRLLVSELANDDLTLAVRVAVNEALYLRRETPPRNPPRERFVLLDSGIRMWGVPRVFATAVGLALAATADKNISVFSFRAAGKRIVPVDLTTRAGLIEHLAALDSAAHPAASLAAFLAQAADSEQAADAVLVTCPDVLADPKLAAALAQIEGPGLHIGEVNRDGRFRLFAPRSGRSRPLCDVRMSLDEIMAGDNVRVAAPLIDRRRTIAPPAINSVRPFPLLLSHQLEPDRAWAVKGHCIFAITRDRRLMHWSDAREGARQFADDLPEGKLHWAAVTPRAGIVYAVIGKQSQRGLHLLSIYVDHQWIHIKRLDLKGQDHPRVSQHNGVLFVMTHQCIEAFNLETGDFVEDVRYPPGSIRFDNQRFLLTNPAENWLFNAVSFDGFHIQMAPLQARELLSMSSLFEVDELDGPVGLTPDGDLYFTADRKVKPVKHGLSPPIELKAVSRDGCRIVIEGATGQRRLRKLINVVDQGVSLGYADPQLAVEADSFRNVRPRTLRHRFDAITVLRDQTLALRSRRGVWFKIDIDMVGLKSILLRPAKLENWRPAAMAFDRDCSDPRVGYSLRAAVWPEGSLAFLDSRGLLHLRSADPAIPEMTLVLTDGPMSGWVADGRRFGLRYFTGTDEMASPYSIFHEILEPFTARLPC